MESLTQAPSQRAEQMFGRGLGTVAWQVPVILWIGAILSGFVYSRLWVWLHPESTSSYLRGENLVPNLVELVVLNGVFCWGLSWLLGNIRRGVWLFLSVMSLGLLLNRLFESLVTALDILLHGTSLSSALPPALQMRWDSLWSMLLYAAGSGATVVIAMKLRRRFLFLLPLVALVAREFAIGLWALSVHLSFVSNYKNLFVMAIPNALLFGLALWAGIEFQWRRPVTTERLEERRLNTGFWVIWPAVGLLLGLNLVAVAVNAERDSWQRPALFVAGGLAILASTVMNMVFLYRAWAAIRSPFTTSPGSAVGLLFVPIFNLYWVFRAYPGFATEYQAYAAYHELHVPQLSRGWMLAFVLTCFVTEIPLIGLFLTWLPPLAGAVMISRMGDAVNRLPEIAGTDSMIGLSLPSPGASGLL